MDALLWQRAEPLFYRAITLAPALQQRFIAKTCAHNPHLAALLTSLLKQRTDDSPCADIITKLAAELVIGSIASQGDTLGAYRLTRLLGQGGMASVYLATPLQASCQKQVAIKLLAAPFYHARHAAAFYQEKRVLSRLVHPGIIGLIDSGTSKTGRPYLVMPYLKGQRLSQHCQAPRLTLHDILPVLICLAQTLCYLHQQGIVHCDIKPANVMVTTKGTPVLVDFGIAQHLSEVKLQSTVRGSAWLTTAYASPEQIEGRALSQQTDIYAFGKLIEKVLPQPVNAALATVISQALHPDTHKRYPDMTALTADLCEVKQVLRGRH